MAPQDSQQPQDDMKDWNDMDSTTSDAGFNCWDFVWDATHCQSGLNQIRHFYRYGTFYNCQDDRSRMFRCLKLLRDTDVEAAKKEYTTLNEERLAPQTLQHHVWTFRTSPPVYAAADPTKLTKLEHAIMQEEKVRELLARVASK